MAVLADPSVVDHPDRNRIQKMQLLGAPEGDDEAGMLQNLEMLHDAKARSSPPELQVLQRPAVALKEQVQEEATRWVGKSPEYVIVVHIQAIGDRVVTCQILIQRERCEVAKKASDRASRRFREQQAAASTRVSSHNDIARCVVVPSWKTTVVCRDEQSVPGDRVRN